MAELGEPLSDREQAVLECLVQGSTNREIAQELDISPNTVKVHVRNIFTKLGVSSRTEAATAALQSGLIGGKDLEGKNEPLEPIVEGTDIDLTPTSPPGLIVEENNSEARAVGGKPSLPWRWIALGLIIVVVVLGVLLLRPVLLNNEVEEPTSVAAATAELFIEKPMGDSGWLVSRPMPRARSNMALATVGLDLYQIGGEVEAGVVNLVDVFESNSRSWHTVGSKPTAVADATAAVLFGEIFVPGGRLADGRATSVVEAYSPANNAWRPVTPLPKPVAGGLALSDGKRIYLLGGWDGEHYLAEAYEFDLEQNEWQELPPMKNPRANTSGGVLDDKFFVVGGINDDDELAVCEYFDLTEEEWFDCPELLNPRAGAGAAVLGNDLLYVFGGGVLNDVLVGEVFETQANEWKLVEMPMLEGELSWTHLGVTNVETKIFASGGRQGNEILTDNYIFEPFTHRTFLPTVGGE